MIAAGFTGAFGQSVLGLKSRRIHTGLDHVLLRIPDRFRDLDFRHFASNETATERAPVEIPRARDSNPSYLSLLALPVSQLLQVSGTMFEP